MSIVDSEHRPETPLPEAGHDPGDPNSPISQERDTPTPPAANPSLDMDNEENFTRPPADFDAGALSDDSDLSDLDEEQIADFVPDEVTIEDRPAIAVDDSNVGLLGVHKRKRGADDEDDAYVEETTKKKKREGTRPKPKKPRRRANKDDEDLGDGEPVLGKRQRKSTKARKPSPAKEVELTELERRKRDLDIKIDEALRNPNRRRPKKKDGIELEASMDELLEQLRDRMAKAAKADNQAYEEGRSTSEKLKILPEVMEVLTQRNLRHSIVDPESGIVEAMKFFLEPLADGSLPAYNIQRDLFTVLSTLPVNQDTLTQSGIGKVTLFYCKSKKPEPGIKRKAERLLEDWTRVLTNRPIDYSTRVKGVADYDPYAQQPVSEEAAQQELMDESYGPKGDPNRARLPAMSSTVYTIAPKNIRVGQVPARFLRRVGAVEDEAFRKLKARHGMGPKPKLF
ncbi:MAG: Transcription factor iws1 [Phylliscum demangeonii]|nr:MAG: Transcription factor iws1 [Phylliscum demangeonii]